MSDHDHVTVERLDGVGRIVMDRPDHHNALNRAMAAELRDATADLVEDDDVRCLVLTGEGSAFNTGRTSRRSRETRRTAADSEGWRHDFTARSGTSPPRRCPP